MIRLQLVHELLIQILIDFKIYAIMVCRAFSAEIYSSSNSYTFSQNSSGAGIDSNSFPSGPIQALSVQPTCPFVQKQLLHPS